MFVCYVQGRSIPRKIHKTITKARNEAERLSKLEENTGRNVYILGYLEKIKPETENKKPEIKERKTLTLKRVA